MKYLVLFCALLRLSLGQITTADCMMTLPNFSGSLTSGASLRVCPLEVDQCCTQENEDMLGMSLYRVLQNDADNFTLGSEIYSMRQSAVELYNAMESLREDFITNVIGMLMTDSVDRTVSIVPFTLLDDVISGTLDQITVALSGNSSADSVDLLEVITTFFRNGVSRYYFDLTFGTQSSETVTCGTNAFFSLLFPQVEQAKVSLLAGNLQQMGKVFQLVQNLVMASYTVEDAVKTFNLSQTCNYIWTSQYACPLCAGNNTRLCLGTCNEVLIGCLSPLNQAIVQLNVFRDLVVAGVESLLSGIPLARANLNNFRANYSSILETSSNFDGTLAEEAGSCNIRKRSVDSVFRHKRQTGRANLLPNVMISSAIVSQIMNTNLPSLVNASLTSDREYLCAYLNSNASTCMSDFNSLDVDDQATNPAGMFNTAMLRYQAGQQPYVVTDFVNMDDGNEALFMSLLPSRTIPDTSFLNDTTTVSATPTTTPSPTNEVGGGGAAAISFSLFTTLVALVLAYFL